MPDRTPPKDALEQPVVVPADTPIVAAPVLVVTKPGKKEANTTLSAVGAVNWNTVILAFIGLLQTVIVAFIPVFVSNMGKMEKLGEATYTMANSVLGTALRDTAEAKERLAEKSGGDADKKSAQTARKASDAHIASQKLIDAGGKIVTVPPSKSRPNGD